jgi:hypothetical protein
MNLDDAKDLWASEQDSDTPSMSARSLSDDELLRFVKEKAAAFDRRLWRRDLLESIAAVAVFLFFGWILLRDPSWWTRSGALLLMAGSAYVFWRLRRARTRYAAPSLDRPVAEVLRTERTKVEEQIQLLNTVLWWYLAPITLGALLIVVGSNGWTWRALIQAALVLFVAGALYLLNQRGRRCTYEPRREKLTRLLEEVEENTA